jgi:hypothetical protein
MDLNADSIGAILLALGGFSGFAGLVQAFLSRRKIKREAEKAGADATQVITSTATSLLVSARSEIAEMQNDNDDLREDFEYAMEAMSGYMDLVSVHIYALEQIIRDMDPKARIPNQPVRPRIRRPRTRTSNTGPQ